MSSCSLQQQRSKILLKEFLGLYMPPLPSEYCITAFSQTPNFTSLHMACRGLQPTDIKPIIYLKQQLNFQMQMLQVVPWLQSTEVTRHLLEPVFCCHQQPSVDLVPIKYKDAWPPCAFSNWTWILLGSTDGFCTCYIWQMYWRYSQMALHFSDFLRSVLRCDMLNRPSYQQVTSTTKTHSIGYTDQLTGYRVTTLN